MAYLNHTYELLNGGCYSGNTFWNKPYTNIDNCFKLYQMTQGECFIEGYEETFRLQANHSYLINGNKLKQQYCHSSFSTYWVHFIPKNLIIYQGLLSLPTVLTLSEDNIQLDTEISYIQKNLSPSHTSYWENQLEILQTQTWLQNILLNLFKQHPIVQSFASSETKRIEPALCYLNEHYKETIHLNQLAALCCMHPNYFHRIFKKTLNTTPANYLNLLKMNEALQLLNNQQESIKNIAYELGYANDSHFCRAFKQHYGITPGEYQKQGKEILL